MAMSNHNYLFLLININAGGLLPDAEADAA
jgi:hypothetical protein